MKQETKYKILSWAVVFLALLNISTIATIIISNNNSVTEEEDSIIIDPESSPLSGRYLRSQLNFNQSQLDFYREESRQFRHKANEIIGNLNLYKTKLSQEIHKTTPDREKTKIYSDSIGISHANLKKITTEFYLQLREKCTPEQAEQLEIVFAPLFNESRNMRGAGNGRGARRNRATNQN
ncbi:MAG: hypothetical protein WCR61_05830 [Bacteroidales bacterium]|nr:hypothetical protein [Bacteroidales bacterium]MDD4656384.1 hypothetical protein [Bacteroidales bacterium]